MIVEMRTTLVKPMTQKKVEERFAQALPERQKLSPLGGFFHTDVGTLNQIIELWPYENMAQREDVTARAAKIGWPPDSREFVIEQDAKILKPTPFSPPFKTGKLGNVYEIRQYIYQSGTIPKVIDAWTPLIEARMKLSPMAGCWYTEIGPQHQWVHIWPFQDATERQRVRAEAVERKMWPPVTAEWLLRMENCLAFPASFSPLH
jgi:NIPSNAP protein